MKQENFYICRRCKKGFYVEETRTGKNEISDNTDGERMTWLHTCRKMKNSEENFIEKGVGDLQSIEYTF